MFDPYHKWLGIAPKDQPPNHYRLLGIDLFEADHDVIDSAADRLMAWLQELATGPQVAAAQQLLNEISAARVCLLNPGKKAAYDRDLTKIVASQAAAAQAASPPSQVAAPRDEPPSAASPRREPNRPSSDSGINRTPSNSGIHQNPSSSGIDRAASSSGINRKPSSSGINRAPSASGINRKPANPVIRRDAASSDRGGSPSVPATGDVQPRRAPKPSRQTSKAKAGSKPAAETGATGKGKTSNKRIKRSMQPPIAVVIPLALFSLVSVVLIGAWFFNRESEGPAGHAKSPKKALASGPSKKTGNSTPQLADTPPRAPSNSLAPAPLMAARSAERSDKTVVEGKSPEVPTLPELSATPPPATESSASPAALPGNPPSPAVATGSAAPPASEPPKPAAVVGNRNPEDSSAQASVSVATADRRLPVPTREQQDKARELVKELLTQDTGISKKRDAQKDLSQRQVIEKLLAMAQTMTADPVSCFMVAQEARDRAVELADLPLIDRTVDFMTARFQVVEFEMKAECLETLAARPQKSNLTRSLADKALVLEDRAVNAEDFPNADRLVKVGLLLAKKCRDVDLTKEANSRAKELPNIQQRWEATQAAIATLAKNADDVDARLTLGGYLCFIRENWEEGLPHLASGADPVLKDLALLCREDSADPTVLVERGDAWRKQALAAKGTNRAELMSGARHYYARAVPWITGLPKAVAEKHLAEAAAAAGVKAGGAIPANRRPPPLAISPFEAEAAKYHQRQWSTYLNALAKGTNSIGIPLALIPPGEFVMGTTSEDAAEMAAGEKSENWKKMYDYESPQHRVVITKAFYIGQYEVTFQQFEQFVKATGYKTTAETNGVGGVGFENEPGKDYAVTKPHFSWRNIGKKQAPDEPVGNVSWRDATAFCEWLTVTEQSPYRLPTEAEWEYACRAGTMTRFPFGNDGKKFKESAWSWWELKSVGQKPPNAFGLFDTIGNTSEWCRDLFQADYYKGSPVNDPPGPTSLAAPATTSNAYVVRGVYPPPGHSAGRGVAKSDDVTISRGFRIVREIPNR